MNEKKIIEIWKQSIFKNSDKVVQPPICLQIINNEKKSIFGTLGNFSIIAGKPKSRKTFFTSLITGISLNNNSYLNIKSSFPENKRKVLYFDTEQGRYHAKKVLSRISKICNLEDNEHPENLQFILLREYSPLQRLEIIDFIIKKSQNVGLVIIDGIKDVVKSINNEEEATRTATYLLKWTAKYNIHIVTVLHQNKNDENIRGHLGSELENKAETIIKVVKQPASPDFSSVKSKSMRDIEFDEFTFGINEDNIPYPVDNINEPTTKKKPTPTELDKLIHTKIINKVFSKKQSYKYGKLKDAIKKEFSDEGYSFGYNKIIDDYIPYYLDNNFITKDNDKLIYFNGLNKTMLV